MQREGVDREDTWCCPGHDKFPNETYKNRRSKHKRAKLKQKEHQRARARAKEALLKELEELDLHSRRVS